MKTLTFISIILASYVSFGQTGCAAYGNGEDDYYFREFFSISISPLALLDVYNGASYKGGITFQPTQILRFSADFGGYWSDLTRIISPWDNIEGYNFRASAGLNLGTMSPFSLGLEYEYKQMAFTYFDSLPELPGFTASVNKSVHVFNLYGSYKLDLSQRFYVDLRVNLGVRSRDIFNTHSDELSNSVFWWDSMNASKLTNQKAIMPNLNFAVRLNYIMWEI